MESSFPGRLAGWETHGFFTMEDLDIKKIMEEATQRWLRPNEIHAILCNYTYFTIHVKPVNLPKGGTIVLFDRKVLRNFRKDGHNWKKKKDGRTIKEAHEHLKVGSEERIHVYYAHGQDDHNFVRRCYWLLDKKYDNIVLVHYRETLEQGSPATPVNPNSVSAYSGMLVSKVLLEETDSGADHAFPTSSDTSFAGEPFEIDDSMTLRNHEMRLRDINTLEWEDLLITNDLNVSATPKQDCVSGFLQKNPYEISNFRNNNNPLLYNNGVVSPVQHPTKSTGSSGSTNCKQPNSANPQKMVEQINTNEAVNMVANNGVQSRDSLGRWMEYFMTDSPASLDNIPVESPISTSHDSAASTIVDDQKLSAQEQVFSITDVSPAWALSTEETKVIAVGYYHGAHSHIARSNLFCVFGDTCVPAERVQVGVYRCMALPHTPGFVNFYLSLDGHTPISQVLTFEYRSPSMERVVSLEEKCKWEEFKVQMRLARLLFSTTNSINILSSNLSPKAVEDAKDFSLMTSSIDKDWAYLIRSVGKKEISLSKAENRLFELSLKNKLHEWLLERVIEGCKAYVRDHQGQGVIHLCAILDYAWAVQLYSRSGLSLDFRDAFGWTALHWAAFCGRERIVATLLSEGADPSLVTDPTSEFPGGRTASDIASKSGYDGLAAYLAEKGLTAHFNRMSVSGHISGSLQTGTSDAVDPGNLNEEQMCLKDTLTAYRTAADAAGRIQSAFREHNLKLQTEAIQNTEPEIEACSTIAALKIQHAFRNYEIRKEMKAAARIQYGFRTWKMRRDFLNMRRQAIKIQAVFRGHLVRKQYHKIIWSVGVLEKAILRWRQKRKGFRGHQPIQTVVDVKQENDVQEEFFQVSRKQAEERIERSVVRVQALFRSYRAQQEYRRMKLVYDQAKLEYGEQIDPNVRNTR